MAISLSSLKHGISALPPIITIYGDAAIGKDTFASFAPNPVFIFTENGLGNLDVARWQVDTYEDAMTALVTLLNEPHDFKTVVFSTLDWFEPMVWNYLIRMQPNDEKGRAVTNIEGYGFGKGFKYAVDYWTDFLALINRLRTEKNMMIIFVAHPVIRKVTPPDSDSFDCYMLKLQDSEKVSAKDKIVESSDVLLFANWRVALTDEKLSFGQSRQRGVGSGERVVYTEQRPAYEAKNRYGLPAQIHVKEKDWSDVWGVLSQHISWFRQFDEPAKLEPKAAVKPGDKVLVKNQTATEDQVLVAAELPKFLKK